MKFIAQPTTQYSAVKPSDAILKIRGNENGGTIEAII